MEPPIFQQVSYRHALITGTARDAGRAQGEAVARDPWTRSFFTSPHPQRGPVPPSLVETALRFFDRHCPGLNEEIQGFAEALATPLERIVYYAVSFDPPPLTLSGQCSHVAVLPSHSADGHLRVARNYEFSHRMSDLRLAETRIEGRAAHLGFSEVLFGRDDGMNEHGLCVTMSAGAPMVPAEPGGCMFWALIRTVLDRCATVDEALDLIGGIPLSFNLNLLLADRSGQAALVELASSRRAVRRAREGLLISTNHFELSEMAPYDLNRSWNSVERRRILHRRLEAAGNAVTAETLRNFLGDPFPEGVCVHDYTGYFGTLWSEVFDVTAGTVEVCFGPPTHEPWRTFRLGTSVAPGSFAVRLPDTPVDPGFWRRLPPGGEA